MITYQRDVAPDGDLYATVGHVRAHLSAMADSSDDPTTRADDVDIVITVDHNGTTTVRGQLDAPRQALYDAADFDPYVDVPAELRAEVAR